MKHQLCALFAAVAALNAHAGTVTTQAPAVADPVCVAAIQTAATLTPGKPVTRTCAVTRSVTATYTAPVQTPAPPPPAPVPAPPPPAPAPVPAPPPPAPAPAPAPSPAPAPTPAPAPATLMPVIDRSKLPAPAAGFNVARRQAANVSDPSQRPDPGSTGSFREPCTYSHMSFDDPLVYPNQPGASHLHVFFGNQGANAASTPTSIATTGSSTCAGGTLNRTAYWAPAMIDTATNAPVLPSPDGSIFYYKTGEVPPAKVQPVPPGLRMISGDAKATSDPQWGPVRYACVGQSPDQGWKTSIPTNCTPGDDIIMDVSFPQCWDGKNLDSPDHKSHMADPDPLPVGCPATHPVGLPHIQYEIHYKVPAGGTKSWRLSSDNYPASLPGGYSGHADYFFGWDVPTMNLFIKGCENASVDCHAFLLGDGTMLY